jgi:hypothetical protein
MSAFNLACLVRDLEDSDDDGDRISSAQGILRLILIYASF